MIVPNPKGINKDVKHFGLSLKQILLLPASYFISVKVFGHNLLGVFVGVMAVVISTAIIQMTDRRFWMKPFLRKRYFSRQRIDLSKVSSESKKINKDV